MSFNTKLTNGGFERGLLDKCIECRITFKMVHLVLQTLINLSDIYNIMFVVNNYLIVFRMPHGTAINCWESPVV